MRGGMRGIPRKDWRFKNKFTDYFTMVILQIKHYVQDGITKTNNFYDGQEVLCKV